MNGVSEVVSNGVVGGLDDNVEGMFPCVCTRAAFFLHWGDRFGEIVSTWG